jgi:hypothetical protein
MNEDQIRAMNPFPLLRDSAFHRCFCINYAGSQGTAFLLGNDNCTVLATAAHCVRNAASGDKIYIAQDDGWRHLTIRSILFDQRGYDLALFSVEDFVLHSNLPTEEKPMMLLGFPLIFLGYPHGLSGNYPGQGGRPTPVTRTAFFSGVVEVEGIQLHFLDGISNPGFSGGPVYSLDQKGNATVCGIVNGYRYERPQLGKLYKKVGATEEIHPDYYVKLNSALTYATGITKIYELLNKATDGLDVIDRPIAEI